MTDSTDESVLLEPTSAYETEGQKQGADALDPIYLGLVSFYLFTMGITGILMNAVVIYLSYANKTLRTPFFLLLMNLILADLLVSLCCTMVAAVTTSCNVQMSNLHLCQWFAVITFYAGFVSMITMAVVAVERCLVVTSALKQTHKTLAYRGCVLISVSIWLFSGVWTVAPLLGWGEYSREASGHWCSLDWESENTSTRSFLLSVFVFVFFLPLLVIIVSYLRIFCFLSKLEKSSILINFQATQRKLTRQSFAMVTFFLLAWFPYAVISMLKMFAHHQHPIIVSALPSLFAKSSFSINPVICLATSKNFRNALAAMFRCKRESASPPVINVRAIHTTVAETEHTPRVNLT